MTAPLILPDPGCSFGYPLGQVAELLSGRLGEFWVWMVGKSLFVCDKQRLLAVLSSLRLDALDWPCFTNSHGPVVWPCDLQGFLQQAAA